jgi:hypothetical protein
MEVGHLGTVSSHQSTNLPVHGTVPNRNLSQRRPTHLCYPVVVRDISKHLVAACFKELALSGEYFVFAAGLLVMVVQEQNPHCVLGQLVSLLHL